MELRRGRAIQEDDDTSLVLENTSGRRSRMTPLPMHSLGFHPHQHLRLSSSSTTRTGMTFTRTVCCSVPDAPAAPAPGERLRSPGDGDGRQHHHERAPSETSRLPRPTHRMASAAFNEWPPITRPNSAQAALICSTGSFSWSSRRPTWGRDRVAIEEVGRTDVHALDPGMQISRTLSSPCDVSIITNRLTRCWRAARSSPRSPRTAESARRRAGTGRPRRPPWPPRPCSPW